MTPSEQKFHNILTKVVVKLSKKVRQRLVAVRIVATSQTMSAILKSSIAVSVCYKC
jgi:hypothetical protein